MIVNNFKHVSLATILAVILGWISLALNSGVEGSDSAMVIIVTIILILSVIPSHYFLVAVAKNSMTKAMPYAPYCHAVLMAGMYYYIIKSASTGPGEIGILIFFLPFIAPFIAIVSLAISQYIPKMR